MDPQSESNYRGTGCGKAARPGLKGSGEATNRSTWKKGILMIIPVLVGGLLLQTSCNRNDNEDELKAKERRLLEQYLLSEGITQDPTASGLYYIPIEEGTGDSPVENDWVEFEYIGELIDGTVFTTSYDSVAKLHSNYDENYLYRLARTAVNNDIIDGLQEGFKLMKTGGKAKLIIPSDQAYAGSSSPAIPAYSTLIFTLELLTKFSDPATHERELIQQFLADSGFVADSTATGLYYIEQVEGTGEYITTGDIVDVWYTGFFLDGGVFDSNIDGSVFSVSIPSTQVILGWDEGLRLMRKGSKGILIIPYELAYGELGRVDQYGRTAIPRFMTLVFEIEIDDVT